jgi:hypothetical protein
MKIQEAKQSFLHKKVFKLSLPTYQRLLGKAYRCSCCDQTGDSSIANIDTNYKRHLTFHYERKSDRIFCSDCVDEDKEVRKDWEDTPDFLDESEVPTVNASKTHREAITEVFKVKGYDDDQTD